ncbi:Rho-binding antiterminator [Marinomonas sp. GJ51-6]|uniref:Rho-binding antiterminator n=1 Tax=Marinomonas sp. GJ51-6 TaxID=2992802 RepID=UPI0029345C6F|nr:Rho-binding antiterminator [Marinomonas sp. GJ51-6]WOD08611.1 Rho-binding antiterminator [Marinomonas sp. GJ51-6]
MIRCHEYDLIEIVCMHRYPIRLTMKTGEVMEGIAMDTQRNEMREECIKMKVDDLEQLVVLDHLFKLEVCVENPHFSEAIFSE